MHALKGRVCDSSLGLVGFDVKVRHEGFEQPLRREPRDLPAPARLGPAFAAVLMNLPTRETSRIHSSTPSQCSWRAHSDGTSEHRCALACRRCDRCTLLRRASRRCGRAWQGPRQSRGPQQREAHHRASLIRGAGGESNARVQSEIDVEFYRLSRSLDLTHRCASDRPSSEPAAGSCFATATVLRSQPRGGYSRTRLRSLAWRAVAGS